MFDGFSGGNLDTIKEQNISATIKLIQMQKGISRVDISAQTGLKQATITKILSTLTDYNLITETKNTSSERGRPPVSIELNAKSYYTIGLHIKRGKIKACSCDICGTNDEIFETDFNLSSKNDFLEKAELLIQKVIGDGKKRFLGIGIASPRSFGDETQFGNLTQDLLSKRFNLPCFIIHDAICAALNEYLFVSETKPHISCYIANDMGIGAAILFDGVPFCGSRNFAGEIGHTTIDPNGDKCRCGNVGCLEHYCSTLALERYYGNSKSADEILNLVNAGDKKAVEAFNKVCSYLAICVINIVRTINPDEIIISDKLAIANEMLYNCLTNELSERLKNDDVIICVREYFKDAILMGANAYVLSRAINEPVSYFGKYINKKELRK